MKCIEFSRCTQRTLFTVDIGRIQRNLARPGGRELGAFLADFGNYSVALTGHVNARFKSYRAAKARADVRSRAPKNSLAVTWLLELARAGPIDEARIRAAISGYEKASSEKKTRINVELNNTLYSEIFKQVSTLVPDATTMQAVLFVAISLGLDAAELARS